jgi:hypothetical protein
MSAGLRIFGRSAVISREQNGFPAGRPRRKPLFFLRDCSREKQPFASGRSGNRRKQAIFPKFTPDKNYDPQGTQACHRARETGMTTTETISPGNDRNLPGILRVCSELSKIRGGFFEFFREGADKGGVFA